MRIFLIMRKEKNRKKARQMPSFQKYKTTFFLYEASHD